MEGDGSKLLGGLRNYSWQFKEKMKRFRRWMKTRRAEDRENYHLARQEAERVKRIAKQESFEQIRNDLENDFDGAKKLIYHMAKNYRKESQSPSKMRMEKTY